MGMTDQPGRGHDVHARDATPAVRTFVDADGVSWRVHEQSFSEYDRRKGRSLIFSSDGAVRRVRDYPQEWMTLTDTELSDLSWKA
jgi:hypothetical protein